MANGKLGDDFDTSLPSGLTDPRQGDNYIADAKYRLKQWAITEHNDQGKHKIPVSASPEVVDATAVGHLSVRTGTTHELYYDTGTEQKKLTSNSEVAALQAADATFTATDGSLQSQVTALDTRLDTAEADIDTLQAQVSGINIGGSPIGMQLFTANGYFTVPAGITKLWVRLWGGTGGGGHIGVFSPPPLPGPGGGCGGYAEDVISVTPGQQILVSIGAGGLGGIYGTSTPATGGGATIFSYLGNPLLTAGPGGDATDNPTYTPGTGGAAGGTLGRVGNPGLSGDEATLSGGNGGSTRECTGYDSAGGLGSVGGSGNGANGVAGRAVITW